MLANTHFETLLCKRLGEASGLFHAREALSRVDVEGIGIDGFAVMHRVSDSLKEAQLESVASFDADAQIWKDEEALVRAVDVLQVVEARDA